MVFNISAGHAAVGKGAVGAVGILNESVEDRRVKNEVIRLLRLLGHTVYDCTVDSGNASQILSGIVQKCNQHKVDVDVSIHFNSGANDKSGNGKTTGTEVFIYDTKSTVAKKYALDVVNAIERLGFRNRGVKTNSGLYFLKYTNAQAILIECCFVDDKDDALLYDYQKMAEAIVYGLTGQQYIEPKIEVNTESTKKGAETATGDANAIYRVQVGAFHNKANADALKDKLGESGFTGFITKA